METGSGYKSGTKSSCSLLHWLQVLGEPLWFRRKRAEVQGTDMLQRENSESIVLKLFIFLSQARECSGEGLRSIFMNLSGVPFDMLMHQNVCIEASRLFLGYW